MTPEEIDRTIEFILQTEARTTRRVESLHEDFKSLTLNVEALTGHLGTLAGQLGTVASATAELIESKVLLRRIVENHERRLERLEGESPN